MTFLHEIKFDLSGKLEHRYFKYNLMELFMFNTLEYLNVSNYENVTKKNLYLYHKDNIFS